MKNANTEYKNKISIFNSETGKVEELERIVKSDEEWRKILTPEQYRITRRKGTEPSFSGKCELGKPGGIYKCVACGTDLFRIDEKFESGTGWPSFWNPVSELNIEEMPDNTLGIERTELLCARCGAHLGHVFKDGPAPTYKRYCINATALKLVSKKPLILEKAIFAMGCFWGGKRLSVILEVWFRPELVIQEVLQKVRLTRMSARIKQAMLKPLKLNMILPFYLTMNFLMFFGRHMIQQH